MIQNLHTHTTFCDGAHTAEEMVQSAMALGMDSLGFSGHSPLSSQENWTMTDTAAYRAEIHRLQEQYGDRIKIFLGLEQDLLSPTPTEPYDYLIGSVHCLLRNGVLFSTDGSREQFLRDTERFYGGDALAFGEEYYEKVALLPKQTGCQIIGHFDLITKFNEDGSLFDESHPRYQKAALSALSALLREDVIFEVNTGAISRGYRTVPYPAPFLLKAIHEGGGRICITTDCHHRDTLLTGRDAAITLAKDCGFSTQWILTEQGFAEIPLDFSTPK